MVQMLMWVMYLRYLLQMVLEMASLKFQPLSVYDPFSTTLVDVHG
jgi:hypothetical protein